MNRASAGPQRLPSPGDLGTLPNRRQPVPIPRDVLQRFQTQAELTAVKMQGAWSAGGARPRAPGRHSRRISNILSFVLQALERDERGRKVRANSKVRKGHGDRRPPNYFRIVRPVTGFSSTDMSYNVRPVCP